VSETALKAFYSIDSSISARIKHGLKKLESDPFRARPKADIKKLHGPEKPFLYRLRVGDYRVIYFVLGNEVKVTDIIHRGKGYNWLE